MKKWRKGLAAALSTGLLAMALTGNALAAEERTKISQVSLNIESLIEAGKDGSDVNVSIDSGTGYSLDDVTVKNDEGEWISGDEPRVEITLEAEADYYFDSMSKSKVKLKGDAARLPVNYAELAIASIMEDGSQMVAGTSLITQLLHDGVYGTVAGITRVDVLTAHSTDRMYVPAVNDYSEKNIMVSTRQKISIDETRIEVFFDADE